MAWHIADVGSSDEDIHYQTWRDAAWGIRVAGERQGSVAAGNHHAFVALIIKLVLTQAVCMFKVEQAYSEGTAAPSSLVLHPYKVVVVHGPAVSPGGSLGELLGLQHIQVAAEDTSGIEAGRVLGLENAWPCAVPLSFACKGHWTAVVPSCDHPLEGQAAACTGHQVLVASPCQDSCHKEAYPAGSVASVRAFGDCMPSLDEPYEETVGQKKQTIRSPFCDHRSAGLACGEVDLGRNEVFAQLMELVERRSVGAMVAGVHVA